MSEKKAERFWAAHAGTIYEEFSLWERPHTRAGEEYDETGVADKTRDALTAVPISMTLHS